MKRLAIFCICLTLSLGVTNVTPVQANDGLEVRKLPTIFEDGFHIPDHIEWTTWEEARNIIPTGSRFQIIDVDTGLFFTVQRRAGSDHADVQPLTQTDTAIMKGIYNGKWSWKRRAIFIQKGTHFIPASMHGMPHGAGALTNNFPGHFCIHLPKSTTHKSNKEDPIHQLMILKAAGKLDTYLKQATSEEVANVFIHGVNQEDYTIINKTTKEALSKTDLNRLFFITPLSKPLSKSLAILVTEYPLEVQYRGENGLQKRRIFLRLERSTLFGAWQVKFRSSFHPLRHLSD